MNHRICRISWMSPKGGLDFGFKFWPIFLSWPLAQLRIAGHYVPAYRPNLAESIRITCHQKKKTKQKISKKQRIKKGSR